MGPHKVAQAPVIMDLQCSVTPGGELCPSFHHARPATQAPYGRSAHPLDCHRSRISDWIKWIRLGVFARLKLIAHVWQNAFHRLRSGGLER